MRLTPELLLRAYSIGVFPMAESRDGEEIHWIEPRARGVLPLDALHVPRKLRKRLRHGGFTVTCDQAFPTVIAACAEPDDGREDTWINPVIERLYAGLFERGFAHSVECWRGEDLVGGLYGVSLGAAFMGESMFSRESDASKVALVHLVLRLVKGGYVLLDTQFETPHLAQFGVVEIPQRDYRRQLSQAIGQSARFPTEELEPEELEAFLKSLQRTDGGSLGA
ncbi:MAG: leucyl/phenylalanyl-tRNA--protein transferase [Rhodospirillales bacterium]